MIKDYLLNSPTSIVILWAQPTYTTQILQYALDSNVLGPKFTWILSSSISLTSFANSSHEDLIGLLSIEPAVASFVNEPINRTLLNAAYHIWQEYEPESFPGPDKVNFYGLFAFDAMIETSIFFCAIFFDR